MKPVRLLIVAHAPLASALKQVAQHVFADAADEVQALDVPAAAGLDEATEALGRLHQAHRDAGVDTLVLVDVAGATPSNACVRALAGDAGALVLQGVNVPMVWRALAYRRQGLSAMADKAREGAFSGIRPLGATD